ncbi:MAG: trimethylamine methyltransferase family protein [Acidobacteriota bacterium]|jgi:trimethylamine--corrinoid protein Co-methyltransferase
MENNFQELSLSQFRFLDEQQLTRIHEASLHILSRVGVTVDSAEALELLDGAGADASNPKRVLIPADMVEKALETAPSTVVLHKRDGTPFVRLTGNRCTFGGTPDQPDILDPRDGKRRPCRIADVVDNARLIDALPNLTWSFTSEWAGYPQGLPAVLAGKVSFMIQLENSEKPLGSSIANVQNLKDQIEVCSLIAGGTEELRRRPFFFGSVEPITPLVHGRDALEKSLILAEHSLPNVVYVMPMAGATAPATFAGTLAVANAELLSHLTLMQLKREGAPMIYGAMPNIIDMRTTIFPYGSPELNLLVGAATELAHHYNLPMLGTAGCTDAKVMGVQTGLEVMAQCMTSVLSGANMVHDVGLMDHATMISPELMVLTDEIIGMTGAMLRRLEVDDESLALDLIEKVGPGGSYLAEDHTLNHFRSFWVPEILDRSMGTKPGAAGSALHSEDRLREKTLKIIESHTPKPLEEGLLSEIKKMEKSWFERLGLDHVYPEE